jgi:hypothetical protein
MYQIMGLITGAMYQIMGLITGAMYSNHGVNREINREMLWI